MLLLILFLACIFVSVGSGLLAAASDVRGLTIPNVYSAVIVIAFFAAYIPIASFGPHTVFQSFWSHMGAAIVVFGVTAAMFGARIMGAADSKLLTAYAFWFGMARLMPFLFNVAIAGGFLGIIAILIRKTKPFKNPRDGGWIARLQGGESKVPYGAAILAGALVSFAKLGYFGPEVLASFLPN